MIIEMFPPAAIALNDEVSKHPLLLSLLQSMGPMDLETTIGHVAAYCDVMLDDYYMNEDLEALFNLLVNRLRAMNTIHIN